MYSKLVLLLAVIYVAVLLPLAVPAHEALSDSAKQQKIEAMYAKYKKSFQQVADLSAEHALKLKDAENAVFVDVREPRERAVSMLRGAITDKEFLRNPAAYKDHLIIG